MLYEKEIYMPILGIEQPEYIQVADNLRLRKYDGEHDFALLWYQDQEMVKLVDGEEDVYTMERLGRMYSYLNNHGELYFIEILEQDKYIPIGDVTFWQQDMPIVIGEKKYRGKGIGYQVIQCLIQRGKQLGYDTLYVNEIYDFNIGSRKCFEKAGFQVYEKTTDGHRYRLEMNSWR